MAGAWYHKGESLGELNTVVVTDTDVTMRCVDGVETYDRETIDLGILKELPADVTVVRDD
ncbi:hypothetical protein HRTV-28_gp22 [Halorubrum tailed virus 28]|uniref:Uncharacterized protein n=1 Tax=Halorubrum tailed virus 28 TaxID=2878009 RepID=A0AAE8XZA5_9CAUD|nr:hypothetical protein M1M39_gp23 [Halorubrum tailed virus 28]UBF23460.1 hypothetical protein HRTV-28_gp22 [Halorubrum tailed virus 28]